MINLSGNELTLAQVAQVAYDTTTQVSIAPQAIAGIEHSRQIIESVLVSGQVVYGVNTGFGALSNVQIPLEDVQQLQTNLIRSHAVGTGPLLDQPTVRAMVLLRANTLAKGFSGVRLVVIQTLLEMLHKGVHPCIPSQGSLGASGDLAPLAHLALVLIGEGIATYQDQVLPGHQAMALAGIPVLSLQAKEGLALLNGTQMMTAVGILTLLKAEALANIAELAGAMSVEAVMGSHLPFDDRIAQARAHVGHSESATLLRQLLQNSEVVKAHQHCTKVQDPYSLRCIPQVHGAVRDSLRHVRQVLEIEANSATDNPLIFPDGSIISQGNFHGEPVAMALDLLSIAVSELASISERRIDKLMNPAFSDLPAFLAGDAKAGLNSGLMIVHYTAASLVSENKTLCHPACVDTIPTSNDKEDHVSMGAIAARKAAQVLKHTRWVLAAELLCAAQGLEFHTGLKPGNGVNAGYRFLRQHIPALAQDRSLAEEVEKIADLIDNGSVWAAVQQAI